MKKLTLSAALLVALPIIYSCKSAPNAAALPAGTYALDASRSSLQATVMKNEKIPVILKLPKLDGRLALKPFKASMTIGIDTLDTGNPARDSNVRSLFFEVAEAANKTATFELTKLDGDPSALPEGKPTAMRGEGTLSLHGGSVSLSGPLVISKLKGAYVAAFNNDWTVNIKDAGLLPQLANLSDACPQPHRVGLDVTLSGNLAFVRP